MYRMYDTQWDGESDDERNSLNSSFWSDGERKEDEEEEEVEIETVLDSKLVSDEEDVFHKTSEEEKPELNSHGNFTGDVLKEGNDDDDDEISCSSSDCPAPSMVTSGYGTYRPEEPEGGDHRDDYTITEFDQDSRGDFSELRDDEEDYQSFVSFGEFAMEPTHEPDFSKIPVCMLEENKLVSNPACYGEPLEDIPVADVALKEEEEVADEREYEDEGTNTAIEEQLHIKKEEAVLKDEMGFKKGERREKMWHHHELRNVGKDVEDRVEANDPDESSEFSSDKDTKFINSKMDSSWMMFRKVHEEREGHQRRKKDAASCLEEQLAELNLSASPQQEFEEEDEVTSDHSDTQSTETDGMSLSAFESYVRGMAQTESDGDFRPKPKSFIRPVMSQRTIKKTDPVAKYFQYKQLWEMFKLPGERDRKALRLEIKERLAYQPPPPKPRRVYMPNTYVVPTEKKRSALCWQIRNDLANGFLPHKSNYRL